MESAGQPRGGTSSQPSRSARVASSVREATPNRSNSAGEVRLDGLGADPERRADLVVAAAVDDEADDVVLARREADRARARPDGEGQPAGGDPPDRVEQLGESARS